MLGVCSFSVNTKQMTHEQKLAFGETVSDTWVCTKDIIPLLLRQQMCCEVALGRCFAYGLGLRMVQVPVQQWQVWLLEAKGVQECQVPKCIRVSKCTLVVWSDPRKC